MIKFLIFLVFVFTACDYHPHVLKIEGCQEVYYEELNAGTFTNIVTIGPFGDETHRIFGKYECVDGEIVRIKGGNKNHRRGLHWKKMN